MSPVQAIENIEQKRQIQLYFVWKSATKNRLIWHTSMRLSTKRIDQIVNISITVQQNIQGKLTRINYFKLASQGEIMIVLHLQKVTYSLSDEVSFFSDFQAFKSFLFMWRALPCGVPLDQRLMFFFTFLNLRKEIFALATICTPEKFKSCFHQLVLCLA